MKGILFKPEVWQAKLRVLEQYGEAQTRRVIKLKGYSQDIWNECVPHNGKVAELLGEPYLKVPYDPITDRSGARITAHYGIGETVYVKEKALYWVSPILEGIEYDKPSDWWSDCVYQDDPEIPALLADNGRLVLERSINQIVEGSPIIGKWVWKSSLHMPEHYARYFITITDVRAERLQEINSYDIEREGLPYKITRNDEAKENYDSEIALEWFRNIWNFINKDYSWESNPWDFAYTFKQDKEKMR